MWVQALTRKHNISSSHLVTDLGCVSFAKVALVILMSAYQNMYKIEIPKTLILGGKKKEIIGFLTKQPHLQSLNLQ